MLRIRDFILQNSISLLFNAIHMKYNPSWNTWFNWASINHIITIRVLIYKEYYFSSFYPPIVICMTLRWINICNQKNILLKLDSMCNIYNIDVNIDQRRNNDQRRFQTKLLLENIFGNPIWISKMIFPSLSFIEETGM